MYELRLDSHDPTYRMSLHRAWDRNSKRREPAGARGHSPPAANASCSAEQRGVQMHVPPDSVSSRAASRGARWPPCFVVGTKPAVDEDHAAGHRDSTGSAKHQRADMSMTLPPAPEPSGRDAQAGEHCRPAHRIVPRKPSPSAVTAPTMIGDPAQHSAARTAPMTPAASAAATRRRQ